MEEWNNKLNSGDPVVVTQTVSKLVQIIKTKKENDILEVAEFKFLKEKSIINDNAINAIAAEGILKIARDGDSSVVKSVITDLVSVITTTKCSSNVAFLLNNLLLIDLQHEVSLNNSYKSGFNLRLPQHPFIIVLNEDLDCWSSVFREIMLSYRTADESVIPYYNELYKPVFIYILCHPQGKQMLTLKQKLWSFVIQKEAVFGGDNNFISTLLSWMQFENTNTIQVNSDFLIELSELNRHRIIFDPDLLVLWQISALHQLILNNFDPRSMIFSLFNSLESVNNEVIFGPILLLLAKCISSCPAHLLHLLKLISHDYTVGNQTHYRLFYKSLMRFNFGILFNLRSRMCCWLHNTFFKFQAKQNTINEENIVPPGKVIISKTHCDVITRNIIKASLLQWMTNPSDLMSDSITYANNLFSLLQKQSDENNIRVKGFLEFSHNSQLLITNSEVYFSTQMYILLESWRNENDLITWLEKLSNAPDFFLIKTAEFLIGLFLTEFEQVSINIKAFELILRCVDYNKALSSHVLTVILFKLTSVTDSKVHYQLLKAVPKMAVTKNNFQKVVGTIQALNKGRGVLTTFSATLMLDLWKIDSKCYPHLEKFLITPYSNQGDRWEFFVTKAHVLKELCTMKPELYGREIVAHLSKILNECNNADGALACALAVDGITLLCKSEIIDAVTTWATLEPMFKTETRTPVIKSLCVLISEIPTLSYSEAYPKLTEEVVAKLWEYLLLNPSDEIWVAALNAFTSFTTDQIVAQAPEEFFDEETLNIRKSGHVVPGSFWTHFLKNCTESKLKIAGDFLIKLTSIEISNYLKFVYQVKGTREPVDYSYLPVNSVVRGISTYIKSKMLKWTGSVYKEAYLQCLRVFSQEYVRPLPPLDWCFLQELFHEPEAKDFCVNIAAHQVVLSGTARRFIVNYIEALVQDHTNESDVLLIYRNLRHLANSVQPFTLKPFLEGTMCNAVELFKSGSEEMLRNILTHVKDTLKNEDVQEANKIVIAQIISDVFNETDISTELFRLLLDCVILFPTKCVNDMSSPKSVKEIGTLWFKKAVIIRCYLAINSNNAPLNLLNELMENGSVFTDLTPFMFKQFATVFEKHKNNTECVLWMLELIGQIQAITAEKSEQKEIFFLCNIFILATIVFSGHSVFMKDFSNCKAMYKLFPRAMATLLDVNHWSICTTQALEWFYHMYTEKMFHKEYSDMFAQCLRSLRHETEFHKNMKWIKYLNVEC